jgi:hypothetical protein
MAFQRPAYGKSFQLERGETSQSGVGGNSIVLGGNRSKHDEKLGALLEKELTGRYIVWPVAAGGWSNINEMTYLDRNIDVLRNADAVIIEFMDGGLGVPTPWPGHDVFPEKKPWLLTMHMLHRLWLSRSAQTTSRDFGSVSQLNNYRLTPVGS